MTRVRIGMGGLYLATRLAVLPDEAYTTISFACQAQGIESNERARVYLQIHLQQDTTVEADRPS